MKLWGIMKGGITFNSKNTVCLAVDVGDQSEVTGTPLIMVVEKIYYDDLQSKFEEVCERARKQSMEIDTRWAPSLKKAKHEAAVFQQELMDKHEEMVLRIDSIDKVLDYERKRADANFKGIKEQEAGRLVAMQALHEAEEREIKLRDRIDKLMEDITK